MFGFALGRRGGELPHSSSTHSILPEELKHNYPARVFPPPEYRPPEYLAYLERAAAAVKTVRLVVYAGMAGFLLLSAYGFFLIYELTVDTHRMVEQTVRRLCLRPMFSRWFSVRL